MATTDIGRVTPIWRGFYSAATTYELNDIVIDTAGSVWWHKSEELTTGVIPEAGEIWDAVLDMSVFSGLIQAAITTAQTALEAAQAAVAEVTADTERAETAAQNAENSAAAASESAAGVGALAQAAEQSKTEAQTAATQAAASASSAGTSAASAGSSAQAAETSKTAAQTAATQAAGSAETASGAAAVVEQKKAEAIAAIEAKGEEVLESIPEDYTELSGDVGAIKTQVYEISGPGKNLFDKDHANIVNAYINTVTKKFVSNSSARTVWIECEPNTTYTISKTAGTRFVVAYGTDIPAVGQSVDEAVTYNNNASITITTDATAKYLSAWVWNSSTDTGITEEQMLATVMIEEGETASAYEPYQLTAIDLVARKATEDINDQLDAMDSQITVTSERAAAEFGDEMIADFSALTPIGASSYNDGKWTIPYGDGLETALTVEANARYYIVLTVTSAPVSDNSNNYKLNPLTISLGNDSIDIYSAIDANFRVCLKPTEGGVKNLILQCSETRGLVLSNLSVRKVTALPAAPLVANGNRLYASGSGTGYSTAFGGGQYQRVSSLPNTAFGYRAQYSLDSGIENTAVGYQAQFYMRNGRANTAVGNGAQTNITTGMYNNAFGTMAQAYITGGSWNNAFGNEAQRDITTGCNNVGMGRRAQSYITKGSMNTAVGAFAGFATKNHQDGAWGTKISNGQTLIGAESTQSSPDDTVNDIHAADYLTTLGYRAIGTEKAIAIGANAEAKGKESIAIGYGVTVTTDKEISVGTDQHTLILCGKRITFNQDGTVTWEPLT